MCPRFFRARISTLVEIPSPHKRPSILPTTYTHNHPSAPPLARQPACPLTRPLRTPTSPFADEECVDTSTELECATWQVQGHCGTPEFAFWMSVHCTKTCRGCEGNRPPPLGGCVF